ncbi:NADPH HC-toxin reductase 1 isoform X2 [Elaeis guineensis]|uniref:Anthocyanidin reductase isoform X2 n=1 Tax=Elaeis guineensis var. tenera TaxID=51953 RepID=A0A8N4EW54_ELAGV|nr:putative anthocyanidin reductase isoform X2 [Elaeis guineensis]
MMKSSKVCVTGASGYLASWLIRKLLEKGHVVHATLRNLGDESKTRPLKSLPGADTRLLLFESDLFEPHSFEAAIQGCEFVFLLATPMSINANYSQHNLNLTVLVKLKQDIVNAAVAAVQNILRFCELSGTVKRVIYTGSVTAASPLKEDGTGYEDFIDETCWTPLDLSFAHCEDLEKFYTCAKTLSEKEVLSYNYKEGKGELQVVSLTCGLVGGDTILPFVPLSVRAIVSPLTGDKVNHRQLKFLQALLGSVPLVHIEDVCEAHAFCMEMPSMTGRFLLARANPSMQEIVDYLAARVEGEGQSIQSKTRKLVDMGFKYGFGVEQILDDSVECAKRLGELNVEV